LLVRLQRDDTTALELALGQHWTLVVDYINRLTGSEDAAEDVAQRAFCQLWDRRAQWRPSGSVRALLCRIARNYAISDHRRQRADERSAETFVELTRPAPPSRDRLETEQLRSALDREIALPRAATRDSRPSLRTRSLIGDRGRDEHRAADGGESAELRASDVAVSLRELLD
jgi:RNA polymerase sigma-70 factor (ECF subfamily)